MPKGIPVDAQANAIISNVRIEIATLPEEENNERIKRLARKILRVVENDRGYRPATGEDIFSNATLEQNLAI